MAHNFVKQKHDSKVCVCSWRMLIQKEPVQIHKLVSLSSRCVFYMFRHWYYAVFYPFDWISCQFYAVILFSFDLFFSSVSDFWFIGTTSFLDWCSLQTLLSGQTSEGVGAEILQELQALRTSLANAEIRRLRQVLDCWHSNSHTVIESTVFMDALAVFYGCARTTNTDLKCMLTGNFYPRPEVRASHIIKRSTNGDTMHLYGLPPNIDHVRNGLLLLEPIEQAFDRKC